MARVERHVAEQTEQFAQLTAIYGGWWASSVAADESQLGSLVGGLGSGQLGAGGGDRS
jgi:hypothetical protein